MPEAPRTQVAEIDRLSIAYHPISAYGPVDLVAGGDLSSHLEVCLNFGRRLAGRARWAALLVFALGLAAHADGERSWRTVDELTPEERARVDLGEDTPRDSERNYLPAERYPFEPPYSAEEMGYRLMNFNHLAHWSHMLADVFGTVTKKGYLTQGIMVGMIHDVEGESRPTGQIDAEPGAAYQRWNFYYTYPPKDNGFQSLWVLRRTGPNQPTRMDYYVYSPSLRRVRRQPPPRRDSQFPDSVQSFDDIVGLEAWEFRWRFLGADALYETVRFPKTRPKITMSTPDGHLHERPTAELKMMGDEYPYYRPDGGVDTFVLVAVPRRDWLPTYQIAKLIYWVDQHYFYPLRIEQYDDQGNLRTVQVRLAERQNPSLPDGEGYTGPHTVYWDAPLDLLAYSVHDALLLHEWSEGEKTTLFTPEFMRRRWLQHRAKSQVLIDDPQEFFLRPRILRGHFPDERPIELSGDTKARIAAQDAAGALVFEKPEPVASD